MADDSSLRATSLELYQFLCQHIVGTEETVRLKRLLINMSDNVRYNDVEVVITSGSVGEGLELKGSDFDIMSVDKSFIVHEDIQNAAIIPEKFNMVMEIHDTKPGFTLLRFLNFYFNDPAIDRRFKSFYLSSDMFKLDMLRKINSDKVTLPFIHGPCLSNKDEKDEKHDLAYCLHSPYWIQPAGEWINRSHTSWPCSEVKSEIIRHGVLFVPIGCKGSVNEDLEWRISFSVAEKLLIYSFSHTQLLCYALMKILLKDIISSNINCKNLLCSYFIKTIIFWVSEETPVTEWNPENLIQCFMRCFRRLLYCVEFSMCPHYFIPINNLFESKIEKQHRQLLLGHLNTLSSFGWRCVLLSEQLKKFSIHSNALPGSLEMKGAQLIHILSTRTSSFLFFKNSKGLGYRRCIRTLVVNKSSVVKLTCLRNMSCICSVMKLSIGSHSDINKMIYSQRRTQLAYLSQNIHHDVVSGWILIAAFFYKIKRYRNALHMLSYAIMNCAPEKRYNLTLQELQQNLTKTSTLQRLGILRALNHVTLAPVNFLNDSSLMPEELALYQNCSSFRPDVFAHFLCFLCHYHLKETQECNTSIRNLQVLALDYQYFNPYPVELSLILFGVALQIYGQKDFAIRVFTTAAEIDPSLTTYAAERISMIEHKFRNR